MAEEGERFTEDAPAHGSPEREETSPGLDRPAVEALDVADALDLDDDQMTLFIGMGC